MAHRDFGINLLDSSYELHPSERDTPDVLNGSWCAYIKLHENMAAQLLNFCATQQCYEGMQIGQVELMPNNKGVLSLDEIGRNLPQSSLLIAPERNVGYNEVYETEYDRPPSNAMYLRRKGFIHAKITVKPSPTAASDHPIKTRIRGPQQQRAETAIKEVRGSQRLNMKHQSNKRPRQEQLTIARPQKKMRVERRSVTLKQAIGEVLYVGQHSYEQVKNMIASRTPLSCDEPDFSKALNSMATFYEPTMHYYLKSDYHEQVEWEKSEILTKHEKQVIRDRTRNADDDGVASENDTPQDSNNATTTTATTTKEPTRVDDPEAQEFERQYAVISEQQKYNEYNTVYNEKLQSVQEWAQNIQVNKDYFKRMRKLINDEQDADKKAKMMSEFRIIFEERKPNIKHLQQMVNRTRLELLVVKNRINDYVKSVKSQLSKNA